jgi:hypothetical protein
MNQPQSHISSSPIRHMPKRIEDQLCTSFVKQWLVYEHSGLYYGFIFTKGGHADFFLCPKIANPQNLGLIPQSQIRKLLSCASPQLTNPQICNDLYANRKYANFLHVQFHKTQIGKEKSNVSDPDPHWFASNTFFTYVSIF